MNDKSEAQQSKAVKQARSLHPLRWISVIVVVVIGLYLVGVRASSITRIFGSPVRKTVESQLGDLGFSIIEPAETHRGEVYVVGQNSGLSNGTDLQEALVQIPYSIALKLNDCGHLESLSALENAKVVELDALSCDRLIKLWRPGALPNLRVLNLAKSQHLANLLGCSELPELQELTVPHCDQLNDVSGLAQLPALRYLNLTNCSSLTNVDVGGDLTGLKSLELEGCTNLTSLSGLRRMPALDYLDISGCSSLKSLATLPSLPRLKTLVMCDDDGLRGVEPLKSLPSLNEVYVGPSPNLARSVRAVVGKDVTVRRSRPF